MNSVIAEFAPAEIVSIKGEKANLPPVVPKSWHTGHRLRHLQTIRPGVGTSAHGAIDPDSVAVHFQGKLLALGKDFLIDREWGSLGLGPDTKITPKDVVTVDYTFSLRRLDSLVRTADGKEAIRKGKSNLTVPEPPLLGPGEVRLANFLIPYHSDGKNPVRFDVAETAAQARTLTTPGRIPKTLEKLKAGKPVTIVCWGDSVTAGGDASGPATRYPAVFEAMLKKGFPAGNLAVKTIAIGGSNSRQWLYPEKYPFPNKRVRPQCIWQRIADAHPDLVTIEFVNDAGLNAALVDQVYGDILQRLQAIPAEVIFITPHFTMMSMMRFKSLRDKEQRPYVLALRNFAEAHGLALADASSRWEHLQKEGIPYITLLRNGINHPDDRGHRLFAEELVKCFDEK